MGVVIAVVSSKGGCGKSTAVLVLAGAFAEQGHSVRIIDADRAERIKEWSTGLTKKQRTDGVPAKDPDHPDEITVAVADEATLEDAIEAGKREAEVVLIDVEGTANAAIMTAAGHADLCIVPANHSSPDVKAAIETIGYIRRTENIARRPIHHAVLWSRVPNFQSRDMNTLENEIVGVEVIGRMKERTAYRSLFLQRTVLDWLDAAEVPNLARAQEEGRELRDAVVARIAVDRARSAGAAA